MGISTLEQLMIKYAELHSRILSGAIPPRYLVYVSDPGNGYGNKCGAHHFIVAIVAFYIPPDQTKIACGMLVKDADTCLHLSLGAYVGAGYLE